MITKDIHISVHLEGIPVEFNAVQIDERSGTSPSAIISFPADSAVLTILPKTIAHIFYRDEAGQDVLIFMGELGGSGIVFTSDKRVIQLTFRGITQNWQTNVIIPEDLKIRNLAAPAMYAQVTMQRENQKDKAEESNFLFLGIQGASPLDPIFEKLVDKKAGNGMPEQKGARLFTVLEDLMDYFSINYEGIYWNMLSNSLYFHNMLVVDRHVGMLEIEKVVKNQSVIDHIKSQSKTMDGATSVATFLKNIFSYVGLDYTELAAPTQLGRDYGSNRAHILVEPQTHYFPPLIHNLVTDDNITQLNFSRNFDVEPTRIIAQTVPFELNNNSELNHMVIGTLIPANVRVLQGVNPVIKDKESYDRLRMFGLTTEEQCRGVLVGEFHDNTGIENAYLNAVVLDNKIKNDTAEDRADIGKKLLTNIVGVDPNSLLNETANYHANIGSIQYYDMRHASRTLTIQSPYSPYRMAGFPGVLISKYLPKSTPGMIGFLEAVSSTISADGSASQSLSFTHCRLVSDPTNSEPTVALGFLDDNTENLIPWYKGYIGTSTINTFYAQFTGRTDSAIVFDPPLAANQEGLDPATAIFKRVAQLRDQLIAPGIDMNSKILALTRRPLVTKGTIEKIYPKNYRRKLINPGDSRYPIISYEQNERGVYIKERQDRVNAAFKLAAK